MNHPWAIRLDAGNAPNIAVLRQVSGLEFALDSTDLWIRSPKPAPELEPMLRGCPVLERFEWVPPEALRPVQSRIPSRLLPRSNWRPIHDLFQLRLPAAAVAASRPRRVPWAFVRDDHERAPTLISLAFSDVYAWSMTAPLIRLHCLRFAVRAPDFCLLWGTPLPPLSGQRFVVQENLATPAGWRWDPAIEPGACRRWLQVGGDSMLLFDTAGNFARIHLEQFVPLTRSALLRTRRHLDSLRATTTSEPSP